MKRHLLRAAAAVTLLLWPWACTNDYSDFSFVESPGTGGGGTDAASGAGGAIGGSGGAVITGGTGGVGGTGGAIGGTGGADPCAGNQKSCGGQCVPNDDPAFGCDPTTCSPCTIANATAQCAAGQCALLSCNAGHGDCNGTLADGCEEPLDSVTHCGGCARACSQTNSVLAECDASACKHRCDEGFGDCVQPTTGPDDGCESVLASSAQRCGSCENNCALQGASGGFECAAGICGCTTTAQCVVGGGNPAGSCDTNSRRCVCAGTDCQAGEHCAKVQGNDVCRCNGQAACSAGETCCQTPNGCRDLESDADNCGACGKACPQGTSCKAGSCEA